MAYLLVVDNRGREVARFHHSELHLEVTTSLELLRLRDAVTRARTLDDAIYDPRLNDMGAVEHG